MNNIFEESNLVQFNCNLKGIDEPFFIPLEQYDPIFLRLQIPYNEIDLNGGAGTLPNASNVQLYITDEAGNTIFDMQSNPNKYAFGKIEKSTERLAEYQFLFPIPFGFGSIFLSTRPQIYKFIPNVGDIIEYTTISNEYFMFKFDTDEMPERFFRGTTNTDEVFFIDNNVLASSLNLLVNGVAVVPIALFDVVGTSITDYSCFRIKVDVQFGESGHDLSYYTKPFKIINCEDTILLEGYYPLNTIDCEKHIHQSAFIADEVVGSVIPNYLRYRLYADMQNEPNFIKKTYNSKLYNSKAEKRIQRSLISGLMPNWYVSEIENLMMANNFKIERQPYYLENSENITENTDLPTEYKNINVILTASKCETVFVCQ